MADERKDVHEKDSSDENPDFYVRTLAATWGHLDLIRDWVKLHKDEPGKITENVLFPAAMYGQLEVLNLAIPFGDLHRIDTSNTYPGWTLMHFAVEGAQRNVIISDPAQTTVIPRHVDYSSIVSGVPETQPRTPEEVVWKQLDIIVMLAEHGVPLDLPDRAGHSASFRACHELEVSFLEGAILLDILAILKAERESGQQSPKPQVDTPGLSVGKLPGIQGWTKAVQQVVEWAYCRKHYMILQFCHQHRIIDLTSPKLTLTSPQLVLRNYHHPLLMDAVRKGDYKLLRLVLEPMPRGTSCSPQDILTRVYEYEFGNTGKRKESILSYACSKYFEENGTDSILGSLLSPQVLGSHITNVTLVGVGLRRLPILLFHKNLKSLDVRENNIDFLPSGTADQLRLNWDCPVLHVLNISHNLFTTLHPDLFHLPSLSKLFAAGNKIQDVPRDIWTAPALQHIDLDDNLISALPCPANIPRQGSLIFSPFFSPPTSPTLGGNQEGVSLLSIRQAFVNYEAHSSEELHKSQSGFCLMTIYVSGNQLTEIPKGLPCLAPLLHTLKVARNKITDLGYTSDYPALLQTLDASNNSISSGIKPTLQPLQFPCLQSSLLVNTPSLCSHFNHYKMSNLKFLYLSGNRLKDLQIEVMKLDLEISNRSIGIKDASFQSEMLFPRLQGLRLSSNCLTKFPENIHKLERLCELAIDENPNIQHLPLNLYHLSGLFTFKFHGIGDPIIHELKNFKSSTADLLYYLRALETEAGQNTSMRLFIIGHFHKGKTTLLSLLRGRRADSSFDQRVKRIQNGSSSLNLTQEEKASTVGIECGKWTCSKKHGAPKNAPKITFYTWDFAGQEEYYLTHQCFLTNRALFVLVWNVLDGDEGIESISIWLQNLQAKAPRSTVVVVGTHLDMIPRAERERKCRIWRDKLEKYSFSRQHSKAFPRILGLHFTGCPQRGKTIEVETLNDMLYDVAMDMDAPRDFSSKIPASLKIKILQEKIPKSYDNLRRRIEVLAEEARLHKHPPVMHKQEFCKKVGDIITGEEETEIAVDFLHTTTGVVLHFKIPALTDYYIIDPQQWFDLCALVISPENVSKLVRRSIGRDPNLNRGLLNCDKMDHEFEQRGYDRKIGKLIRTFLHEYNVIHQINHESCLVPSAISTDTLYLEQEQGVFPFSHPPPTCRDDFISFPSIVPTVLNQTPCNIETSVQVTGLLYRRLLLLPPIASGFWSKLIALFIQKHDFQQIVLGSAPASFSLKQGAAHHLLCMVGNLTLEWQYWKTGIMLFLDDQLLLRVNSLRSHEFEDPQERIVQSDTQDKVKYFHFKGSAGWQFVPRHYTEVIEVVVPEVCIIQKEMDAHSQVSNPMSAKILTKALEIIDEVMKNHCEHLATSGIYAVNDLLHVVPCPLCFGDADNRPTEPRLTESLEETLDLPFMSINPARIALQGIETPAAMEDSVEAQQKPQQNGSLSSPVGQQNSIYVYTVDDCIKQTFMSDYIECPIHGQLEAQYLVPDLVFADLADVRLEKGHLSAPLDRNEEPDAMGSFGVVVKRVFFEADKGETEVAVKIFSRYDDTSCDSSTELIKNYSDMRYELNKLSSLAHPHIVRFIGVFTNPHSFVLEWAPEKTLQHIHQRHTEKSMNICTTSLFLVLLQITNALIYLHEKVGIVHRDLKLSNILVFRFPEPDHICYNGREDVAQTCTLCFPSEQASCGVLLKLTDMGICANPAAHRAKDNTGIRQFVPECLTSDTLANLTEKVDIFTLGSCLYELMTLRCLPPDDISEIEYKHMLQSGKRPQFYRRDTSYPLLLFQFLEECWQHKHFKRPSAGDLKTTLQTFTGFSVPDDSDIVKCAPQKLLMDTFVLHQSHRVSASHAIAAQDSFSICAALSSSDESTTTVAVVNHHHSNLKTKLQMKTLGELKNQHVSALHMTADRDILVGCADGKVILFDSTGTKMISDPASSCFPDYHHGEIIGLYHDVEGKLLVIGFSSGNVHIKKCTEGIRNCLVNQRKDFCSSISDRLQLHALECISSISVLEIWCGGEKSKIEVWSLPERECLTLTLDTVSQQRQITTVQTGHTTIGMAVKQMKPGTGLCESKMVALLHKQNTTVIVFVDMTSKIIEKTVQCNHSVASFTLSPTKLLIGTYDGKILLCDTEKLLNNESTVQTFSSQPVKELRGHWFAVYSLLCVKGHISTDGTTSFFPTFIGKPNESLPQEFLVSIGFGKGHKELAKIFKGSVAKEGTYINTWLL